MVSVIYVLKSYHFFNFIMELDNKVFSSAGRSTGSDYVDYEYIDCLDPFFTPVSNQNAQTVLKSIS